MRSRLSLRLLIACVLSTSCAPAVPPLAEVIVPPRRAPAAGANAAACVVTGLGDPLDPTPFEVFQDPVGGAVVAVVRLPASAPAELSRLTPVPVAGAPSDSGRRALARFEKRGLRLSGWVDLTKRNFTLRARFEILGENLWAEAGTLVHLWGSVHEGRALASAPTPFDRPKRVAFAIPCELLEYGRMMPKPASAPPTPRGSRGHASPGRLDFFAGPDGAPLFSVETRSFLEVEVVDRQLDRVRIVVGRDPISTESGTLFAQGWVPMKSLGRPPPASTDRDTGSIPDSSDRCPIAPIASETEILLGSPRGLPIAWLEAGTPVKIVELQGEFAAIELDSGIFGPPNGVKWWVRASAIQTACEKLRAGADDLDGCPECP